jgi:hypothetical protein
MRLKQAEIDAIKHMVGIMDAAIVNRAIGEFPQFQQATAVFNEFALNTLRDIVKRAEKPGLNRVRLCDELPTEPRYYFFQEAPEHTPEIVELYWDGSLVKKKLSFCYDGKIYFVSECRKRLPLCKFSKQIILEE